MNNFEKNLKKISKQDINIPESFETSVYQALDYILLSDSKSNIIEDNKFRLKNKLISIIQKIIAFIAMFTIGITAYAGISGNLNFQKMGLNKLSSNYEDSKILINKTIENDYMLINLENIARDSAYVILEYNIKLKEKVIQEFGEITYDESRGYNIGIANRIEANETKNPFIIEFVDKKSDTEYTYYQIIYTMGLYESKVLNLKIWFEYFWKESYTNNIVQLNEIFEISSKIENEIQEDFEKKEAKLEDGSKIVLDKILNTNFQTFIMIKRTLEDMSVKDYKNREMLQYKTFIVTDTNGEIIPYTMYTSDVIGIKYYNLETNEYIEQDEFYNLNENVKVRIEEDYVILLDSIDAGTEVNVIPVRNRMYDDRKTKEEKEKYDEAIWYPLVEGEKKYSATSCLGGTLEIDKIEIDEKNITFHFNKSGIVANNQSYVIIRKNNGSFNYVCAQKQDITNSGTIVFPRNQEGLSGAIGFNTDANEYYQMLEKMKNLEFTLLFGIEQEFEGITFNEKIPEQINQNLEIESFTEEKTYTKIIDFYLNSSYCNYTICYDNEDNILKFDGDINILSYYDKEKVFYIRVDSYEKVMDLINEIKKHLEYKNIEYTIQEIT